MHGGSAPQVLAKARQRLLEAADSAAAELVRQSQDKRLSPNERRSAVLALLDRAGLNPKQAVEHTGADGGPIETLIRVEFTEPKESA